MKTFAPPFFNHSSLSLNRKKACGNKSHEKETKHIDALAAYLLHIRRANLDRCKCAHCKNDLKEIGCPCCRQVDVMLIASAKIPEREGPCHPAFIGNCTAITHTC